METLLSVYRHPALTVLIDDSQSFLDSLDFRLSPLLARKSFQNTQMAMHWLRNTHWHSARTIDEPITVDYDEVSDSFERRSALIQTSKIYQRVNNRMRFDMPAVLVVDYAMPQMSGVEFCEAVSDLNCKKILLTGQADEDIVIDAFNRKLIDRFIKKSDSNATEQLETEIIALQKEYFREQSCTITDLLSRHSYDFLADPTIAVLIKQLCKQYQFIEYYLFPDPTGILFFDMQGKPTLMVIATESSLTTQLELAIDQQAPPELLTALRKFRLIPFFYDSYGSYQHELGDDWLTYCLPPQICRGEQTYYWALFELPRKYLPDSVFSYAEFLQNRQAE